MHSIILLKILLQVDSYYYYKMLCDKLQKVVAKKIIERDNNIKLDKNTTITIEDVIIIDKCNT